MVIDIINMLLLFSGKLAMITSVIRCESQFKSMSLRELSVGLERQFGRVPLISGNSDELRVSRTPRESEDNEGSEGRYEERWNGVQTTTLLEREYYRADLMSHTYVCSLPWHSVDGGRTSKDNPTLQDNIVDDISTAKYTRSASAIFMFCQVSVRLTRHAIRIDLSALFLSPHCSMKKYNNAANISSSRTIGQRLMNRHKL